MITESAPATVDVATSDIAVEWHRLHQLRALVVWFGAGLFALGAAIISADLVFPEPTVFRLPLMLAIITAVGLLLARLRRARVGVASVRRAGRFAGASPER